VGTYGSIQIAADGSYTYTVDNSNAAVQALRLTSQTLSETFTYRMADTAGLTSLATVTITIQGANDTPVGVNDTNIAIEAGGVSNGTAGTNPTGNVLINDTDVDAGDTKTVTDVAAGSIFNPTGSVGSSVVGTYGSIQIAADGSYTYTVDNTNATVQALRLSSQTLSETFTYRMADTEGLTSLATITITIQGSNDNPVAVADTGIAVEAGGYANATPGSDATGNVLANDTDVDSVGNGETKTVSGVAAGAVGSALGSVGTSVTGAYGAITIGSNGAFTYVVDDANTAVQALRLTGQTLTDVFSYTVTDTSGLTSTAHVTITIQGANDAPNDIQAGVLEILENSVNGSVVGTVVGIDVDSTGNGEVLTYSLLDNANGRFQIDSSTGIITVANSSLLDREMNASHTIQVRVADASGLIRDKAFTIQVIDQDEFDVGTVTDTDTATNGVFENSEIGTIVGITANAFDADATNNTIQYSLVDNDGGRFGIDSVTGVMTVAGAIDREADGDSRNITVRATSSDGSYTDQTYAIAIYDIDEFALIYLTDIDTASNAVFENTPGVFAAGITAYTFDSDATNNTITYTLDDSAGGRFIIDAVTGVVYQTGALDHEVASSYSITIRATSEDMKFQLVSYTIQVLNVNETPYANNEIEVITENQIKTISVLDNDYDLDPGDSIHISTVQISQGLGQVQIVGGVLSYNPGTSYDYLSVGETAEVVLAYQVEDLFGLTANATVTITIEGQRDQLAVQVGNVSTFEDTVTDWPISVVMVDINGETCTDVVIRGVPAGTIVTDALGATRVADQTGTINVFGMSLTTLEFRLPVNYSGTIFAEVDVFTSYGPSYTQTFHRTLEIAAVADPGVLIAQGGKVDLSKQLVLPLGYEYFDLDGSETVVLEVQGIPRGMMITDGVNSYVSANPATWVNLNTWNVSGLKLITAGGMPGDYSLNYRLTTTETSNDSTAQVENRIGIRVHELLPQIMVELAEPKVEMPKMSDSSNPAPKETIAIADVASEGSSSSQPAAMVSETNPTGGSSTAGVVMMSPVTVEYDQDYDLLNEFESPSDVPERLFATLATMNAVTESMDNQPLESRDSFVSSPAIKVASAGDSEIDSSQNTKSTSEERLQEQSEMAREVQRNFTLQGRIVAFWNMLRGGVNLDDTSILKDYRQDVRPNQRSNKGR
ncbi:MAG: VCBS domain-containing protein, partial [Planctomycetota bacterium]